MQGFKHISARFITWVLGGAAVTLLATGLYQQHVTRNIVLELAVQRTTAVAESVTEELQGLLRSVESSVQLTAVRLAEAGRLSSAEVEALPGQILAANPRVFGSTVAFESGYGPVGFDRFAPYLNRRGDAVARVDPANPERSYWNQEWYRQPLQTGGPVWIEPYLDEGAGNLALVTYAAPFFRREAEGRKPAGVVTADLALGFLKRVAESNQIGRHGFVIVFSGSGRIVTHPETKHILQSTLAGLAEQEGRPGLRHVVTEVAAGRSGSLRLASSGRQSPAFACFRPIKVGGWGILVGFDEDEFLTPVRSAGAVALGSASVALALLAVIIVFLSRRITQPLAELAGVTAAFARGDLDAPVPAPRSRDEVGQLAHSFGRMRDDLRRHIAELAATTAARQKIESELAIALQIQRAMLPPPRQRLAGATPVEIAVHLQPAKVVGGDLYSYFQPAPGRLCFAVGDVSDKGVPAALFMARTITLLKTAGRDAADPAEVLRRVNAELYPENDECMFVTLLLGALDLATGELLLANAGHEAPLRLGPAGAVAELALPAGPALGLQAEIELPLNRLVLAPGETLLLYTDGVTEAANPGGEQFGRDRLRLAAATPQPTVQAGVQALRQQLQDFVAGAPPADDITVFALRRG